MVRGEDDSKALLLTAGRTFLGIVGSLVGSEYTCGFDTTGDSAISIHSFDILVSQRLRQWGREDAGEDQPGLGSIYRCYEACGMELGCTPSILIAFAISIWYGHTLIIIKSSQKNLKTSPESYCAPRGSKSFVFKVMST